MKLGPNRAQPSGESKESRLQPNIPEKVFLFKYLNLAFPWGLILGISQDTVH